jgi:peptide chain release factor 1
MSSPNPNLLAKLDGLAAKFDELEHQLVDPAIAAEHERLRDVSIKRAALAGMVERYRQWQALRKQIAENEGIVAEKADAELAELAASELPELNEGADSLLEEVASELVTADDLSIGSVMLEVRSAAGGLEAALWAGDIFEMYQRYAVKRGWSFEILEHAPGDAGGLRNALINVRGPGVWQRLGYEGGVHCVKRVPATETQGRIHTSTCTVAVLPEPEKIDLVIPDSDVKMDITTAQGPGGQNVNKVATAVKMVHIPTGIEVRMQESKSQQQNRAKAWQLLRTRVYDLYQQQKHAERAEKRSTMIGSGERSERIRTYRYKEAIAVDHRVNESFNLEALMAGEMDGVTDALIALDRERRLAAL